jgi:hypothetical protein
MAAAAGRARAKGAAVLPRVAASTTLRRVPDATRIRLGMVALAVYGVLIAAAIVARGPFVDPSESPEPFARAAGSPRFVAYSLGSTLAVFLGVYGFLALYAHLAQGDAAVSRAAFKGLALSLGLVLLLPILGVYAFAGPPVAAFYRQDPRRAVDLAHAMGSGWYLLTVLLQAVLYCAGSYFFGLAIWRSGTLPRWAGPLFVLQGPMTQFVPLVSYAGEILGGVLLAVSTVWIAWASLRQARRGD